MAFFKDTNDGVIPSMKDLKEKKEKLLRLREDKREAYRGISNYHKDLQTAVRNVEAILGPDKPDQREIQRKGSRSHAHRQEASL